MTAFLSGFSIILFFGLFAIQNIKGDETLRQIEHWIRYSVCGTERTIKNSIHENDFAPPWTLCPGSPLFVGFVSSKCFIETKIDINGEMGHTSDDDLELTKIRCPPRSGLRNDLYNLPNLWHIMARKNGSKNMQNFNAEEILGSWMAFECGAGSSEKAPEPPNWWKSLKKISDLIGWLHFDAFSNVNQEHCSMDKNNKMLDELSPLSIDAGIDLDKIKRNLKSLCLIGKIQRNFDLAQEIANLGQWTVRHLLHLVLYRTLQSAIDILPLEQLGGFTRAKMSKRDYAVYELVLQYHDQKTKCHRGMPRQDYVLYWLRQMCNSLKKYYRENRAKFLESTKLKPGYNHEIKTLLKEWAKYVLHWDNVLDAVEKHGIQELDSTIDLIGPTEKSEENDE